jgi:hypothetical protein
VAIGQAAASGVEVSIFVALVADLMSIKATQLVFWSRESTGRSFGPETSCPAINRKLL